MSTYLRLLGYLRPYRSQLTAAIVCMVIYAITTTISLSVVSPFMRVLFERPGMASAQTDDYKWYAYSSGNMTQEKSAEKGPDGSEVRRMVFERAGLFIFEADLPPAAEYKIEISASPVWQAPPDDRVFSVNIGMIRLSSD